MKNTISKPLLITIAIILFVIVATFIVIKIANHSSSNLEDSFVLDNNYIFSLELIDYSPGLSSSIYYYFYNDKKVIKTESSCGSCVDCYCSSTHYTLYLKNDLDLYEIVNYVKNGNCKEITSSFSSGWAIQIKESDKEYSFYPEDKMLDKILNTIKNSTKN